MSLSRGEPTFSNRCRPALKRVLVEAERDAQSEAFAHAERTSMRYTVGSLAVLLLIVALMVTKPF